MIPVHNLSSEQSVSHHVLGHLRQYNYETEYFKTVAGNQKPFRGTTVSTSIRSAIPGADDD
jgi:hypothetical protein